MTTTESEGEFGRGEHFEGEHAPEEEYVGERNKIGQRHGAGINIFLNGDYYKGYYKNDRRYGTGMYVFSRSGARYVGDWRKGERHGIGTFLYPDGSFYMGQWKRGFKEGYGAYTYPNGDKYEGQWRRDRREGLGAYSFSGWSLKYMGEWRSGRMEGRGQLVSSPYTFHGTFTNNKPLGRGVFTFRDAEYAVKGFYKHQPDTRAARIRKWMGAGDADEEFIIAVWKSREIVPLSGDLVPPLPRPYQYPPSEESSGSELSEDSEEGRASQELMFTLWDEIALYDGIEYDEIKACRSIDSWSCGGNPESPPAND